MKIKDRLQVLDMAFKARGTTLSNSINSMASMVLLGSLVGGVSAYAIENGLTWLAVICITAFVIQAISGGE